MRGSGGTRIEWADIPVSVRSAAEELLGAPVETATNEHGGFSPGLAARCTLADGRRAFVKAVSADQNPMAPRVHRREVEVASMLPDDVPAPRFLGSVDDGHWVVLAFEEIDGRPPQEPWRWVELDLVVPAVVELGMRPPDPSSAALQTLEARHAGVFGGWRRLAGGDGDADALDVELGTALSRLAEVESGWVEAGRGDHLVHADLRADNVLLTAGGGVVFVDWPWACRGSAVADLAMMLPSVGLGGGPGIAEVVERHGLTDRHDPEALVTMVAAVAGFFARAALDPSPPGLPRLRAFQRAQAEVALRWLRDII